MSFQADYSLAVNPKTPVKINPFLVKTIFCYFL